MPVQPRTPPGVMELLPLQQIAFQRVLDTIRRGFERFGFLPVETPVFELTEVLLTKSGGETEKQVYFVQSTGSLEQAHKPELALRFDLTVPLARYVAQHENELVFPFRRYQIQRVYRGERAQKGRYREFYQCDIDVIGKDTLALSYDAEVPAVIYGIFNELAIGKFTIRINNRKLLRGLLEAFGWPAEQHAAVLHEVDRLGKMEKGEVAQRVAAVGAGKSAELVDFLADPANVFERLRAIDHPVVREGTDELERVYQGGISLGIPADSYAIDLSIARGLDYYTGTIYETFLDEHPKLGSICSGGRYENLAGHYTKSKLPGVGISIGATRLFSQLLEMKLAGAALAPIAQVLVLRVEPQLSADYAQIATELRAHWNVEVYGADDKLAKQFKNADRSKVPLAIVLGTRERDAGVVKVKDLRTTTEHEVPRGELVARIRSLL
jgi:histidyl-tRNA synthetase